MAGVMLRILWVVGIIVVLVPDRAFADVRVWEAGRDEETGDISDPREHNFLDLTAFAQPGFVLRFADDFAGRTDNTPVLQRARTGINARLQWWLRLRLEIEFAPTPQLQDAFIDFTPHDYVHFRIGQFQIPFLRSYQFNELNLGFIDRPLYAPLSGFRSTIRYLRPRDIGFMAFGRIGDLEEGAHSPVFEYWLGLFLGRGPNTPQNDDDAFLYAARFQLHALGVPEGVQAESDIARNTRPRLAVAGSVYSNCDDRENWNRGWNVDTEFRWQGIYVSGAFFWFKNGPAKNGQLGYGDFCGQGYNLPRDDPNYPDLPPFDFISRGAHAQIQYVLPEVLFPVRNQALEVLVRFDWSDPNTPFSSGSPLRGDEDSTQYTPPSAIDDSDNAPTRYRMTFGLNWFPTGGQELRVQLNYQLNRELEDIVTPDGAIQGVRNEVVWLQVTAGL